MTSVELAVLIVGAFILGRLSRTPRKGGVLYGERPDTPRPDVLNLCSMQNGGWNYPPKSPRPPAPPGQIPKPPNIEVRKIGAGL